MSPCHRSDLRPISLQELKLHVDGLSWEINQPVSELESLTPVRATLKAIHHGTALEVKGQAETIVTLCCDRCLQHYNHHLSCSASELLDFADNNLALDGLEERLDPCGNFDPERWLFEQLHLQYPLVNRCGSHCPGPPQWTTDSAPDLDPRWAALRSL